MDIVFLNEAFLSKDMASLSIMDRGTLFGDGIYEVIPEHKGQLVGFDLHIDRLLRNLDQVGIHLNKTRDDWLELCLYLLEVNGNRPIYIQVSRGASLERLLSFPKDMEANIFAFSLSLDRHSKQLQNKGYKVITLPDIRWQRCDIKSTSMLASTLTLQKGKHENVDEVILYNKQNEMTEGCAVNIFILKNGVLATPPLDNQILPGITRHILLSLVKSYTALKVEERPVALEEVFTSDEVFLSSSTKNIGAIVNVDGKLIGTGKPGLFWRQFRDLYETHKLDF